MSIITKTFMVCYAAYGTDNGTTYGDSVVNGVSPIDAAWLEVQRAAIKSSTGANRVVFTGIVELHTEVAGL